MRRLLLVVTSAVVFSGHHARADVLGRAERAREAIVQMDLLEGEKILEGADLSDGALLLEKGRLALFQGEYDRASEILSQSLVAKTEAGAELLNISLGCARATAAAVREVSEAEGIVVRFQDEDDRVLSPFVVEVAKAARDKLREDLGTEVPRPLRIEMVRDLFTLAAMTGLPEQAAQNTGTVAVAKWGRITILSPRAVPHGYPWADTLVHEMAHLWQTRASQDRAPLWLQEGVAKREETRWREPRPLDDFPAVDAVVVMGQKKGLFRPLDKLGGSIALLPNAEQAAVAFAEVESFVRFWVGAAGPSALPKLLSLLRTSRERDPVASAMPEASGQTFEVWTRRWMDHLTQARPDLPSDVTIGQRSPSESTIRRQFSLGEMLRRRGHAAAAAKAFARAHEASSFDPVLRQRLAEALLAGGDTKDRERAAALVRELSHVHSEFGPWYALSAWFLQDQGKSEAAEDAFRRAIQLAPLHPPSACGGKKPPELPESEPKASLCKAARANLARLTDPSAKPYD